MFHLIYPESTDVSFVASSGWLSNFIARHGIRVISLQVEALSADTSLVDPFKFELLSKIELEGHSLDQVFNADETGLWWKLMPSKSLVLHGKTQAKNFKWSKDRVALLSCCNASGTSKIPLNFHPQKC